MFLLSFTDSLFISCYRHNSSLTLGEELASSFLLSQWISLHRCPYLVILVWWGGEGKSRLSWKTALTAPVTHSKGPDPISSLDMEERWQTAVVIGKKKKGRSETTEASPPKENNTEEFFCFTLSNLYRENNPSVKVLTSFLWPLWAWLIHNCDSRLEDLFCIKI